MEEKKTELEKKIEQSKKGSDKAPEKVENKVKGTEAFMEAIKNHLRAYVKKDPLFMNNLRKETKNIEDCVTYIFNQVRASGCIGYTEEEIYKLARHYYDEDAIEVGKPITEGEVIVNQFKQPSQEDIEQWKKEARQKVFDEEIAKMRKKPEKQKAPVVAITTEKKEEKKDEPGSTQASLF